MNGLAVKEVEFNGDVLLAAQDKQSEKVYITVAGVCEGIGLNENQKDRQVKNIQSDIVLSQGVKNLSVKFDGQSRHVVGVELDFLPLWLAKISITPKMKKELPKMVDKLIEYQIKAKEVLANAFVHNVTQIVPQNYKESLKALLAEVEKNEELEQTILIQEPKVKEHEHFIASRGLQEMGSVSKSLKVGRTYLFRFLREDDVKVMMKGRVTPYQSYIDRGWFTVIMRTKNGMTRPKTYVTPKGVSGISKLLRKHIDKYPYMYKFKDVVFTQSELSQANKDK
ncbi:hypothetical protein CIL05_07200 [Virgibacillus profundi]|uniref:Antirepressor protein ant N-terminal domain-containing protein n=1 Tax=Virgibacillus profundi TaxID=2024555 RepID=A0A2A2IF20_9BACI|nr:phage antirepressor KilAC domain-containing protein [Virgibacillus profundi]PAV30247.1 hypothetical protein CIL05_07200 [Virgibacillus profundi]PXY54419.1 hypothetical protein CIT14_07285 [Virgibacillus profundi]